MSATKSDVERHWASRVYIMYLPITNSATENNVPIGVVERTGF